jgi:hypothetical protein
MRRCLYIASTLYFGLLTAAVVERYGDWVLEQQSDTLRTLSFKQTAKVGNHLTTAELVIVCDKRDSSNSLGAMLIPFDWLFKNQHETVPVLIEKNDDELEKSDLLQQWHNVANDYIFSVFKPDVEELTSFIKAKEAEGVKSIHFFIPNDSEDGPQSSLHVGIGIIGFSEGFKAFQKSCASAQYFPSFLLVPFFE